MKFQALKIFLQVLAWQPLMIAVDLHIPEIPRKLACMIAAFIFWRANEAIFRMRDPFSHSQKHS